MIIWVNSTVLIGSAMNLRQGIGLLVVFTAYLLIGGAVFMVLEKTPVVKVNDTYQALDTFKNRLLSIDTAEIKGVNITQWTAYVNQIFKNVSFIYLQQNTTMGKWSFYDSTFFCLTVITTIGYGNKYPTTESSRGFCILYALIGIPLTGIWMAGIGHLFSKKLLKVHEKTRSSNSPRLTLIINTITYLIPGFVIFLLMPAAIFMSMEEWSYLDGFYYAVITLTTIGFGDLVAGQNNRNYNLAYLVGIMVWIIFGLGYLSMILNFIAKAMKSKHMKKIEQTLTKNLKQTQDAFAKEVDYLIKTMNDLIKRKHGELPKIHRRSSCPSIETATSVKQSLVRSLSQGSLVEEPIHTTPATTATTSMTTGSTATTMDNPANFIFDLAMAIACGEMNKTGGSTDGRSLSASFGQSDRPNHVAQLLTMALLPQLRATTEQTNGLSIPIPIPTPTSAKSNLSVFDFKNSTKTSTKPKQKVLKSHSVVGNFLFPFGIGQSQSPSSSTSLSPSPSSSSSPRPSLPSNVEDSCSVDVSGVHLQRKPSEPKPLSDSHNLFKNIMMKRQLDRTESSPLSKLNYETFAAKLGRRGSTAKTKSPLAVNPNLNNNKTEIADDAKLSNGYLDFLNPRKPSSATSDNSVVVQIQEDTAKEDNDEDKKSDKLKKSGSNC
ncbi:Potassium channel sub K member 10 [Chamberlinius hualienensis]